MSAERVNTNKTLPVNDIPTKVIKKFDDLFAATMTR